MSDTLLDIAKLVLLPSLGFVCGFAAQWLLQERKSRDELVRALAEQRATALCKLWELTTLPPELNTINSPALVPAPLREQLDRAILAWYTKQAGALYLSWSSTQLLFRMLDLLRSDETHKQALEATVSSLRSRLKLDCGIYTRSESGRQLVRPRPSPWSHPSSDSLHGP